MLMQKTNVLMQKQMYGGGKFCTECGKPITGGIYCDDCKEQFTQSDDKALPPRQVHPEIVPNEATDLAESKQPNEETELAIYKESKQPHVGVYVEHINYGRDIVKTTFDSAFDSACDGDIPDGIIIKYYRIGDTCSLCKKLSTYVDSRITNDTIAKNNCLAYVAGNDSIKYCHDCILNHFHETNISRLISQCKNALDKHIRYFDIIDMYEEKYMLMKAKYTDNGWNKIGPPYYNYYLTDIYINDVVTDTLGLLRGGICNVCKINTVKDKTIIPYLSNALDVKLDLSICYNCVLNEPVNVISDIIIDYRTNIQNHRINKIRGSTSIEQFKTDMQIIASQFPTLIQNDLKLIIMYPRYMKCNACGAKQPIFAFVNYEFKICFCQKCIHAHIGDEEALMNIVRRIK